MPIQNINTGSSANAGNGDSIRLAFDKVNRNFSFVQTNLNSLSAGNFTSLRVTTTSTLNNLTVTGTTYLNSVESASFYNNTYFENISVSDQSNLNHVAAADLNVTGNAKIDTLDVLTSLSVGSYQIAAINDYNDFSIVKNDATGLAVVLLNTNADSNSKLVVKDNISGGLAILHQNVTNLAGDFVAGENYIYGETPTDVIHIGAYSDLKFSASEAKYYDPALPETPSMVIQSIDGTVHIYSSATFHSDVYGIVGAGANAGTLDRLSSQDLSKVVVLNNNGSLVPSADLTCDLGSTSSQWRSLYIGTSTIYLGGTALSVAGGVLTVDGSPVSGAASTSWDLTSQGNGCPINVTLTTTTFDVQVPRNHLFFRGDGSWDIGSYVNETYITGDTSGGNGIALTTDRGTVFFGNSPEICGPTAASHFHIMKQDPTLVDLFFGDDFNNLKLPTTGGVSLQAFNTQTTISSTWTFDGDGLLTLPSGNTRIGSFDGGGSDSILASTGTIFGIIAQGAMGTAGLQWIEDISSIGSTSTRTAGIAVNPFGGTTGTVQIVTGVTTGTGVSNTWEFGTDGNLTLPKGSTISETIDTTVITPPGGSAGQGLVIRPTGGVNPRTITVDHPNGFVPGETITITFSTPSPNSGYTYLQWQILGLTPEQLGTPPDSAYYAPGQSTTGTLVVYDTGTVSLTWTIPENSDMTSFTLTILYTNFGSGGTDGVTVTLDGHTVEEHGHLHLVAGNPTNYDLYLGDDDQYVKIERNAGNVVIGTNTNTNQWTFGTDGNLNIPGDIQDANGSLIFVATTSTAPARADGLLWFNSEDGRAYIKYENNWVDLSPPLVPPVSTYLDGLIVDGTTISTVDSTATMYMGGDLLPEYNNMYDLGSAERQWKSLYVSTSTIYIGGTTLSVSANGTLLVDGMPIVAANTSDRITSGTSSVIVYGDGTVTLPGDLVVGASDGHIYIDDDLGGASSIRWVNLNPSSAMLRVWSDGRNDLTNQRLELGYDIEGGLYITTTQNVGGIGNNLGDDFNWTFGTDGELTLPTGGRLGAIDPKGGTMLDGGLGSNVSVTSFYSTGNYSSCVTASAGGTLYIRAYNDGGPNPSSTWIFDKDGSLTLPEGGVIKNSTGTNILDGLGGGAANIGNYTFDNDNLNMPLESKLNSGGVGVANSAEFGTSVTVSTSTVVNSEIYMGSGYGEFRSIYNKVGAIESGLTYAGVEGFNYAQYGDVNFSGMVSQTPHIDSMYTISVSTTTGLISIGFTQDGGTSVSKDWITVLGTLNAYYTVNGIFADTTQTVISGGDGVLSSIVKLTDSVNITTIDSITTGTSTWTFGTDGVLTLSTASTILGSGTDPNVYIETATTATTSTWTFGTDGVLTLPAATPVIRGGGTGTDVTVVASTGTNPAVWMFEADGTLTFPDTSTQTTAWLGGGSSSLSSNDTASNNFNTGNFTNQYNLDIDYTAFTGDYGVNFDITYQKPLDSTKGVTVGAIETPLIMSTATVILKTDISSSTSTWTFGRDGTTAFPDNTLQSPPGEYFIIQSDTSVALQWVTTGTIALHPTQSSFEVGAFGAVITATTGTDVGSQVGSAWTFLPNGNMRFPDNTVQTTAYIDIDHTPPALAGLLSTATTIAITAATEAGGPSANIDVTITNHQVDHYNSTAYTGNILSTGLVVIPDTTQSPPIAHTILQVGSQSLTQSYNLGASGSPAHSHYIAYAYVVTPFGTIWSAPTSGTFGSVCLIAGTMILLSDGTRKAIEDITYTDKLQSWNFDQGCYAETTALWIKQAETGYQYNLLTFSDGTTLRTFDQHRIFNKEAGAFTYPMTDATPIGTTTVNEHGQEITLVNKQVIVDTIEYYNVITDYHMNLFSDTILTSCRFNNIYPITDMKFVKDGRTPRTRDEFADIPDRFFYGLRLAEQTTDIETVEWYVTRLLALEESFEAMEV